MDRHRKVTARPAQARRREHHAGRRRLLRVLLALAGTALAVYAALVLVHDLRADRTLARRGVAVNGSLLDTRCWMCRSVGVSYSTLAGQKVSGVVSAIGPQHNAAIALRYDPRHPLTVHPAHGVVEEEAIAGALLAIGLVVALRSAGLPRRRTTARRGARIRTRTLSTQEAHGHVRLLGD